VQIGDVVHFLPQADASLFFDAFERADGDFTDGDGAFLSLEILVTMNAILLLVPPIVDGIAETGRWCHANMAKRREIPHFAGRPLRRSEAGRKSVGLLGSE
jgi:hypothetical protein